MQNYLLFSQKWFAKQLIDKHYLLVLRVLKLLYYNNNKRLRYTRRTILSFSMFCKTVADKTVKHVQGVVAALESCPLGRHKYTYLSTLVTLTAIFFNVRTFDQHDSCRFVYKKFKTKNDRPMDNTV